MTHVTKASESAFAKGWVFSKRRPLVFFGGRNREKPKKWKYIRRFKIHVGIGLLGGTCFIFFARFYGLYYTIMHAEIDRLIAIREDLLSFDLEIVMMLMMMMMMMMMMQKSRHGCMFFGKHLPCCFFSWFVHHIFRNSKHCTEKRTSPTIHSPTTSRKHLRHHDR